MATILSAQELQDVVQKYYDIIRAYIDERPIPHQEISAGLSVARELQQYREHRAKTAAIFEGATTEFPPIIVEHDGSSVKIKCEFPETHNCAEFTMRANVQQTLLEAPWIQFSPTRLNEYRTKMACEIARRAAGYEDLFKQIDHLQDVLEGWKKGSDIRDNELRQMRQAWSTERQKYGLKADFSDYDQKDWPI